jgi:hypothetical protein
MYPREQQAAASSVSCSCVVTSMKKYLLELRAPMRAELRQPLARRSAAAGGTR